MSPAAFRRLLTVVLLLLPLAAAAPAGWAAPTAPAEADAAADNPLTYVLQTTDQIALTVDGEADLNTQGTIRADGTFTVTFLPDPIKIAGLTIDEAQSKIAKAYVDGQILVRPKVKLNVTDPKKRQVIIEGHVKSPNHYNIPIETSMTVLDLISMAGGFDDFATGSVNITHTDRDGKSTHRTIDVDAIVHQRKGALKLDDPALLLYPGDLVYAPESIF
jgi:protein involved in polysaccharide export with SLBB domain